MNLKTSIWNNINHYVDKPAMVMKDLKTFNRKSKATPTDGGHTYHLQCAQCVVGYVAKFKDASLQFRVGLQHCYLYPQELEDWQQTVTGKYQAEFHYNMPTPLDRLAPIIDYKDLYYDLLTGKNNSSILICLNKTLLDWYYKIQSNQDYTTSKSESVAAKAAIKEALDLRYTLRMMGNLVDYKTILCNDIATVITKSMIPNKQLGKRPNALATNFTQEAITSDMHLMLHVDGPRDMVHHHTCPNIPTKGE
jgi:hypothetical protein